MNRNLLYIVFGYCCLLLSCGGTEKRISWGGEELYQPRFAKGFRVSSHGTSSIITVKDPWQGADNVELDLFLSRNGERPPEGFTGTVAEAPLKKVVCMSSSYVAFIDALGELDAVKGVSGANYISNENLLSRFEKGYVKDVGFDTNLNYELIASLEPDLVLIYGVASENSSFTRKLTELGINYFYIGEYVEQSPLGKAEWLIAFGEMFDKREQAINFFDKVSQEYDKVCATVNKKLEAGKHTKPNVMFNAPYRDTWFVPGDRNFIVRLVNDAGGEYVCSGEDSETSRPISSEAAFVFARESDVWLNPGQVKTMRELKELNPRFATIPPVISGRVFNCNKRSTPGGGSDFWESGAVRPDIVIKDMVEILDPQSHPGHELYYFRKIE